MDPEWLRYYLAFKLNAKVEDVDFNRKDFIVRINSDLVGKYVNIGSRCAGFIVKRFGGKVLPAALADHPLLTEIAGAAGYIRDCYENRDYNRALRKIMELADQTNEFVDQRKPWELAKDEAKKDELHAVTSVTMEAFRLLTLYLKPVLPRTAQSVEEFLDCGELTWDSVSAALSEANTLKPFKHLMQRATEEQLVKLFELSNPAAQEAPKEEAAKDAGEKAEAVALEEIAPTISFDDFSKVDLRIGKIVACSKVEKSKKLLQLTVDIGEEKPRNIFSGIAQYFAPEDLVGKLTVVVANLAPRKMTFGVSEGMLLSASDASDKPEGLYLLTPFPGAKPGMRLH
jgi:methionyl-tRNA synthetase